MLSMFKLQRRCLSSGKPILTLITEKIGVRSGVIKGHLSLRNIEKLQHSIYLSDCILYISFLPYL
jgi:hypothetical protein